MGPVTAELRLVPEVRSADLERSRRPSTRTLLYVKQYADLDPRSLGADVRRVSAWTAWTWAVRGRWRVVELPEPLWLRALALTFSLGLALRAADLVGRRRTLVVTYAMENNAPQRLLRPLPRAGRRVVGAVLRWLSAVVYDRIAFASPAARRCYDAAGVLPRTVTTSDFVELLPRCDCAEPGTATGTAREPGTVVFLGALEVRKGVPDLLAAWDRVPARRRGWTLRIAGEGRCADGVRRAAAADPSIDHVGAVDRAAVHALLRRAAVVVLPSRRDGRWCEQIGLPIVEGLAHGCRIVATPDTGLAPWLREHGHAVLPDGFTVGDLADALTAALDGVSAGGASPPGVDPLPAVDTRMLAEDWMRAAGPGPTRPPRPGTRRVELRKEHA